MELPCKTETVDVWCDGGNGEDSGVEVLKPASGGSSVLSGYSETENVSECGSDTVKVVSSGRNDINETGSESSSTHDIQNLGRIVRTKKPEMKLNKSVAKPKVPAKPTNLRVTPKSRKSEPPKLDGDGRWPFAAQKTQRSRATSAADPARKSGPVSIQSNFLNSVMSSSCGPTSLPKSMTQSFCGDDAILTLEKYGTLPRRKKKDPGDISPVITRSGSREPSLNRAATLRRQTSRDKEKEPNKSLPPYPRGRVRPTTPKTLILHETAVQTSLTSKDLDNIAPVKGSGDIAHQSVQTEQPLNSEYVKTLDRLRKLLGYDTPRREVNNSILDDLEKHVENLTQVVIQQREELILLRSFKSIAQKDLEKSTAYRKDLLEQQQMMENEHAELQDFLQAEKSTLTESLNDANNKILALHEMLAVRNKEFKEQQEEYTHMVRLCEQRRQENLSLEARLAGLEQRNHDVLRQQGAAVSGAAVALNSLGARLDNLVDQLAVSYNVADKDLEDVIFHNEAFTEDEKNEEKPARRASSFLDAVLGAIKSATSSSPDDPASKSPEVSESIGLLDSEITLDPLSTESGEDGNTSLHNLSAAILERQRTEEEEVYRSLEKLPPDVNSLVDQVILVDNLVTKLLKVIRIVQMENDTYLDQISDEKSNLELRLNVEISCGTDVKNSLNRAEKELKEARGQLNARIQQLEDAKKLLTETWQRESQRQYATIDQALETFQNMQEVVDQFPSLIKLQQQLEDCNFRTASGDDLNANCSVNNSERSK